MPVTATPALALPAAGFVSLGRVCSLTGLSRSTVRRYEIAGRFPRRHRLSHQRSVWRAQDIAEYLDNPTAWAERNRGE